MKSLALAFLLFISTCTFSETISYKIPEGSPLAYSNASAPYRLKFEGQAEIKVGFQFSYDPYSPYRQMYYLFLYPKKKSVDSLPYLTERGPEKAEEIFIRNAEFAAKVLLGSDNAESLISGKVSQLSGEATIVITDFSAGYECDSPTFAAEFVSKVELIKGASKTLAYEHSGC